MASVTLFGPDYSAYTRIARMVLDEKGVAYRLVEVDFAGGKGMPPEQLERHPFGRVPVLAHDGFTIYETLAIAVYVDRAFAGPALQPDDPASVGRMVQIVGIVDSYLSQPLRMGLVSERLFKPLFGAKPDESIIADSLRHIARVLDVLEAMLEARPYLAGGALSLADLHAVGMIDYLMMCPEGGDLLAARPGLGAWWRGMATRSSVIGTRPDLERLDSR